MICCICKKEIKKMDTYYKVELFAKGKKIGTDYAHKICKDSQGQMNNQLGDLVSGLTNFAKDKGIMPEKKMEVVYID